MENGQRASSNGSDQRPPAKSNSQLKCPECGYNMEVSAAFTAQVREIADQEIAGQLERARIDATSAAEQRHNARAAKLEAELLKLRSEAGNLQAARLKLANERRQLLKHEAEMENTIRDRVEKAAAEEAKAAARRIQLEFETREKVLSQEVSLLSNQLKEAQSCELMLRQEHQAVVQLRDNIELEICRRVDQERTAVAELAREQAEQTANLALQQKELQIRRLTEQIEKLQSSTSPRQPELQGESLEEHIKRVLSTSFPADIIDDVARGERGGDLVHSVRNASLQVCGTILWEMKAAKSWNEAWVEKLKKNQCAAGGDLAVIVTTSLPTGIVGFGLRDGVWISLPWCASALATALRITILRVWSMQSAATTRDERLRSIQAYLCSTAFRLQAEQLLGALAKLRDGLEQEERWLTRQWQKRKAALGEFGQRAAEIIGSLEGASGNDLLEFHEDMH